MGLLVNPEKEGLLLASKFVYAVLKFADNRLLGEEEGGSGEEEEEE